MRLITRKSKAKDVAKAWKLQYGDINTDVYEALVALGGNPNPEDIDEVIGNGTWTATKCYECGDRNIDVILIGEDEDENDYFAMTTFVCRDCLKKAIEL